MKTSRKNLRISKVCPQLSALYTENSFLFNKKKPSVNMVTPSGDTSGLAKYVKTIWSWHRKWCGRHALCITVGYQVQPRIITTTT